MEYLPLVLQLVLGAGAATVVGKMISRIDEGTLINAAIGLVGGLVVGQVLGSIVGLFTLRVEGLDMAYLASSIVAGIIGGTASIYLVGTVGKGPLPH